MKTKLLFICAIFLAIFLIFYGIFFPSVIAFVGQYNELIKTFILIPISFSIGLLVAELGFLFLILIIAFWYQKKSKAKKLKLV